MDGLSISVVPVERAGMATGIFNTARVAGEGVTLAIVSAVLAGLAFTALMGALPPDDATSPADVALAAQRLVTGSLQSALDLIPRIDSATVIRAYDEGFRSLIHGLTGVTLLAALAAFGFLRRGTAARDESASSRRLAAAD